MASLVVPQVLRDYPVACLSIPFDQAQALTRAGIRVLGDMDGMSSDQIGQLPRPRKSADLYAAISEVISLRPRLLLGLGDPSTSGTSHAPALPAAMLVQLVNARTLQAETNALLVGLSTRNAQMIEEAWSFKRGSRPTLESLGSKHGITRERVRQILARHETLLARSGLRLPIARRVVQILNNVGGALPTPELLRRCRDSGIDVDRTAISVLPSLGKLGLIEPVFWNAERKLWLTRKGLEEWMGGGKLALVVNALAKEVRRQLSTVGAVPIARLDGVSPFGLQHDLWLATRRQTKLRRVSEHVVPIPSSDSTLTRTTAKLLSVSSSLALNDLSAALQRVRRLTVPPVEVVRCVLDNHPSFRVERDQVASRVPLSKESVLSPSELLMVKAFEQAGGAMLWTEAADTLIAAGYSLPMANAILHGPLFVRRATALYAIRGAHLDPALVRRKKREWLEAREEDVVESTSDGPDRLIARYRLTRFSMQGILPVPGELKVTRVHWDARFSDGRRLEVKVSHGFIRPLAGWFRRCSASVGDIVVATFFLAEGRIEFDHVPVASGDHY